MSNLDKDFSALIVYKFSLMHQVDEKAAYRQLITGFVTCFSIMCSHDRIKCVEALLMLLKDIGFECFEDVQDFASFMKEKAEEHRLKGDFKHDQDADNQQ